MTLEDMVCIGPVHLSRRGFSYRAVWTPMKWQDGKQVIEMHGIGEADTPFIALGRAVAHAKEQGFKA